MEKDQEQRLTYILNFGHTLSPSVLQDLSPCVEIHGGYSARFFDDPERMVRKNMDRMVRMLAEKGGALDGSVPVMVVLPGFTEGAALVLAELSGMLGFMPRVLTLRRRTDGTYGTLVCTEKGRETKIRFVDLEYIKTKARSRRLKGRAVREEGQSGGEENERGGGT